MFKVISILSGLLPIISLSLPAYISFDDSIGAPLGCQVINGNLILATAKYNQLELFSSSINTTSINYLLSSKYILDLTIMASDLTQQRYTLQSLNSSDENNQSLYLKNSYYIIPIVPGIEKGSSLVVRNSSYINWITSNDENEVLGITDNRELVALDLNNYEIVVKKNLNEILEGLDIKLTNYYKIGNLTYVLNQTNNVLFKLDFEDMTIIQLETTGESPKITNEANNFLLKTPNNEPFLVYSEFSHVNSIFTLNLSTLVWTRLKRPVLPSPHAPSSQMCLTPYFEKSTNSHQLFFVSLTSTSKCSLNSDSFDCKTITNNSDLKPNGSDKNEGLLESPLVKAMIGILIAGLIGSIILVYWLCLRPNRKTITCTDVNNSNFDLFPNLPSSNQVQEKVKSKKNTKRGTITKIELSDSGLRRIVDNRFDTNSIYQTNLSTSTVFSVENRSDRLATNVVQTYPSYHTPSPSILDLPITPTKAFNGRFS